MVEHFKEDERAKTEALIKRLDEKLHKQHEKWYFKAAKKARDWRMKGKLDLLYVIDKPGNGRYLKRG